MGFCFSAWWHVSAAVSAIEQPQRHRQLHQFPLHPPSKQKDASAQPLFLYLSACLFDGAWTGFALASRVVSSNSNKRDVHA